MRRFFRVVLIACWIAGSWLSRTPRPAGSPAQEETREDQRRGKIKRWLVHTAIVLAVLGLGGAGVAVSGIAPIKASSGHWAITAWFLNFSMSRSVSTHTVGMKVPPLDDRRLVLKGAGHYDFGCRGCHGSPSLHRPRIAQAMTPRPPYLPEMISQWDAAELFYIVKHGVKFTGMPAWPSQQRDDEVWAMVAFLQRFPELDAEQYQRLVDGPVGVSGGVPPMDNLAGPESAGGDSEVAQGAAVDQVPPLVAENCARCHGWRGEGRGEGAFPRLTGQRPAYLRASLEAYAQGTRHSGIMEPLAAGLSSAEINELAHYFSEFDAPPPTSHLASADSSAAVARGEQIARMGIPSKKVPACSACHGPAEHDRNPVYPLLAGQYADYLALQLELFRSGHRGGTEYAHIMHEFADQLSKEDARDVALYYKSLGSSPRRAD